MPAFAAAQARLNAAVFARLSNVAAVVNGVGMDAIFDNGSQDGEVALAGMAGTQPVLRVPTASLSPDPVGQAVVVNSTNYVVAAHQPDGTGLSVLLLERA